MSATTLGETRLPLHRPPHRPPPRPAHRRSLWCAALVALAGLVLSVGLNRASAAEEPHLVQLGSGTTEVNGTCQIWNEFAYTASTDWIEQFKSVAGQARIGTVVSERPAGPGMATLTFRNTVTGAGLCQKSGSSVFEYTKTGLASVASAFTYVAVLGGVQVAAARYAGAQPDRVAVSTIAGCLAGAVSNAVSNAVLGFTDWRQLLIGAVTSCIIDAPVLAVSSKVFTWAQRLALQHGATPPGAPDLPAPVDQIIEQVEDVEAQTIAANAA